MTGEPVTALWVYYAGELGSKNQEYFGIPPANQSPSGWASVVKKLADMRTQLLPSGKLSCLLGASPVLSVFVGPSMDIYPANLRPH